MLIPETPDNKVGSTVFNYNRCHKSIGTTCIGESPDVKSKPFSIVSCLHHGIILFLFLYQLRPQVKFFFSSSILTFFYGTLLFFRILICISHKS